MKKLCKALCVLLPAAVLLLALHPQGLKIHYADPTAGAHDVAYPYYTAVAVCYGNLGPMAALVLSGGSIVLGMITAAKENVFSRKMMMLAAIVAVAASLVNILYGSMTFIGGTITVLLFLQSAVCWYTAYR